MKGRSRHRSGSRCSRAVPPRTQRGPTPVRNFNARLYHHACGRTPEVPHCKQIPRMPLTSPRHESQVYLAAATMTLMLDRTVLLSLVVPCWFEFRRWTHWYRFPCQHALEMNAHRRTAEGKAREWPFLSITAGRHGNRMFFGHGAYAHDPDVNRAEKVATFHGCPLRVFT